MSKPFRMTVRLAGELRVIEVDTDKLEPATTRKMLEYGIYQYVLDGITSHHYPIRVTELQIKDLGKI